MADKDGQHLVHGIFVKWMAIVISVGLGLAVVFTGIIWGVVSTTRADLYKQVIDSGQQAHEEMKEEIDANYMQLGARINFKFDQCQETSQQAVNGFHEVRAWMAKIDTQIKQLEKAVTKNGR